MKGISAFLVFAASLLTATLAGATASLTVIHNFRGNPGYLPTALIQASDGNIYGVTSRGDSTVFKVTPDGQYSVIFTSPYDPTTNTYPYGHFNDLVEGPDGFLYIIGGPIIRISKSGTDFKVVRSAVGSYHISLATDGNFYGIDGNGIFRVSTSGTYTLLYAASSAGFEFLYDSFGKQATDGNFYAICFTGGAGPMHVCRVTTSGQVTPIHQYPDWPANDLLTQGSDGLLYGSELVGGGATQAVFQLSLYGSYRQLYQFRGCTAKTGCATVLQASDGNLWITNPAGGTVFSITPTGGSLLQTVAIGFAQVLIQGSNGILYGATYAPCPCYYNPGAVFSIDANLPPK